MIEKALLLAGIAAALLLAASTVGDALTKTFAKINPAPVAECSVHQQDTCQDGPR